MITSSPTLIAFDFDGVLVDSVDIKGDAFVRAVANYPAHMGQALLAYHKDNGGVDRRRKFQHFLVEIAGERAEEAALDALVTRFSQAVVDAVIAAPEIAGASKLLAWISQRLPAYIVSATPETELAGIVSARGLGHHFRAVYGSPAAKADALNLIASLHSGAAPEQRLFVGDALTDFRAARDAGWPFLGVVSEGRDSPFPEGVPVVQDMSALYHLLASLSPEGA
ncbi:HAD family hydrolase [Radicibacter daui]|uniref:HAD family hydrolase n=1 Tax=Radicibacter daui TaxID=3064829 RepID=UPI00404699A7